MFLSQDEVADLTGYRRRKCQARWLSANGYRFALNAIGRPKVLRQEAERHLLGSYKSRSRAPNFSALREVL
ncbi:MAG: DUF4224 domain-containing protein [Gammaproteobacteria bacterium]|nr:DUF4224 domain-containing protein [Gammaproteobacteria bacterium]